MAGKTVQRRNSMNWENLERHQPAHKDNFIIIGDRNETVGNITLKRHVFLPKIISGSEDRREKT